MKLTQRTLIKLIVIMNFISLSINAQVKNPILPGFYPDPSICRMYTTTVKPMMMYVAVGGRDGIRT